MSMHGIHARLPKNFVLEERIERYADQIETNPAHWAGSWAEACFPLDASRKDGASSFREVRLDLGCGKGTATVEAAAAESDVLFIGVDREPVCVVYAAQHVAEAGLNNVIIVPGDGTSVPAMFATGELSCIYLNFPTPFPRKKDAANRLVIMDRLIEWRALLVAGGTVLLRTDSQPQRDFALTQFDLAAYNVLWTSDDTRREHPDLPWTGYERRLSARGANIYGVCATPDLTREPAHEQTAELSLVTYLPHDLAPDAYVPYGMEAAVQNLRNAERNRSLCEE